MTSEMQRGVTHLYAHIFECDDLSSLFRATGASLTAGWIHASAATGTTLLPERTELEGHVGGGDGWIVVVYNNDHNTYEQVTSILMKATGCTREEAEIETWEVDHLGKSVVHHGGQEECERVAAVIRTIGIHVEVKEE